MSYIFIQIKIFLGRDIKTLFLPCEHLLAYEECAGTINERSICRKTIIFYLQCIFVLNREKS